MLGVREGQCDFTEIVGAQRCPCVSILFPYKEDRMRITMM